MARVQGNMDDPVQWGYKPIGCNYPTNGYDNKGQDTQKYNKTDGYLEKIKGLVHSALQVCKPLNRLTWIDYPF